MEDLQNASKLLFKALEIRERYMRISQQGFPTIVGGFLNRDNGTFDPNDKSPHFPKRATLEGEYLFSYIS